jgi:hypothetical protein
LRSFADRRHPVRLPTLRLEADADAKDGQARYADKPAEAPVSEHLFCSGCIQTNQDTRAACMHLTRDEVHLVGECGHQAGAPPAGFTGILIAFRKR